MPRRQVITTWCAPADGAVVHFEFDQAVHSGSQRLVDWLGWPAVAGVGLVGRGGGGPGRHMSRGGQLITFLSTRPDS